MTTRQTTRLWAWSLGFMLLCGLSGCGIKAVNSDALEQPFNQQQASIIGHLMNAQIIYLGESHDSAADHKVQLDIIQALYQSSPQLAIALEMFQRPYQSVLDRYIAGDISEAELIEQSEYETRWGYDWELYAPILRFARQHQLPLLALNTPTAVTRKVARQGLASLTSTERQHIPPLTEIRTDNAAYRRMLQETFQAHHHGGHGNAQGFERFFTAQVLWDETMAEVIAHYWQAQPETQVVVLAGRGHIVFGYGIPSRVKRRLGDRLPLQYSVLTGTPDAVPRQEERSPADFFWPVDQP